MAKVPDWYQSRTNKLQERSLLAIVGIGFMIFAGIAGAIFAYYFYADPGTLTALKDSNRDPDRLVDVDFQDSRILIPANLLSRVKSGPLQGVEQIDLQFRWPYDKNAPAVKPEDISDYSNYILVSIIKRPPGFTAREKFSKIYRTYFTGEPRALDNNLWRYEFRRDSPYASIVLYLGRIGEEMVFVTCSKEASSLGPRLCESVADTGNVISVRYRFAFEHLNDWPRIETTIRQLINQSIHPKQQPNSAAQG